MQTKIGFDKFPVPSIVSEVPLNDIITGEPLTDAGGSPLVTEAETSVSKVARSDKAASVVMDPETIKPVPVVEVFPETSENSTSLLGIDRAEVQLSLFSDVSTIGLDQDHWETFNFTNYLGYTPWENRGTLRFGNHYNATMSEQTNEQAIRIGAFPVPYTFPWGPNFQNQGLYNETLYNQFKNFIILGNILYIYFSASNREQQYGSDFKHKFLDPSKVTLLDDEIEYIGITESEGLVLIDEWTRSWVDINANRFLDPRNETLIISAADINGITGSSPAIADTRPGYRTNDIRYSVLQSRKAFRYQPGRISGYTFGARTSTDSGSSANILEWGIVNPTDQYTFQIRGASFSIVRRSTIPLEPAVVIRNGLDPAVDQTYEPNGDPFDVDPETGEVRKYYTMVIPRDLFNGDPVNGNGPSGYLLNPALVTMYKIEFGWYGAIGARFYAYVPVDNGEGRWIVLHTLVIENSLGQPCLEDSFFKFRYSVKINDASTIRTPQFIYKYGASMYIDGGDEGTVTQHSYSSQSVSINTTTPKSILGIYPKPLITNNAGYSKPNKKTILPKSISVTSDTLSKVQIVKCKACAGFGHHYNLGLKTGINGRNINFKFISASRNKLATLPNDPLNPQSEELFQLVDKGAKIIVDGLWSGYIGEIDIDSAVIIDDQIIGYEEASIDRIISGFQKIQNSNYPDRVYSYNQGALITIPVNSAYPYQARLSNYDAIAGSSVPLYGSEIDIQFMNPVPDRRTGVGAGENTRHFAEFQIGVTDKKPVEVLDGENFTLKWEYAPGDERDTLADSDILIGEFTQSTTNRTRTGFESGEANYPMEYKMEIDYRIPNPPGAGSGRCSLLKVKVLDKSQSTVTLVFGNPQTGEQDGIWYIKSQPNVQFPDGDLIGGEIGINNTGTSIVFTSEQSNYISELNRFYYASISGQLPGINDGESIEIQLTPVSITGKHISANKIFKFNPYPLYLIVKLRDNAAVNSISISETLGETKISSSPKWILNSNMIIDTYGGLAEADLPPTNYVSDYRLDSAAIDRQLQQKLRPFKTIDSLFVGSNETVDIDLLNIYGPDRENITTDLFNIESTFFVGSVVPTTDGPTTGTIQISLNTAEQ